MNKLYSIRFVLKNGYVISVYNTFNYEDLQRKIKNNPEWKFKVLEDNAIHTIIVAS